ncbi:MAG: NADH:ubiquinone reductase (Na(+)-transporting) subunit C [Leptospiraceae bacterium]|nr:NADH:ubiquinone reductase (Na(+)-transporting) subunit C [Leptospiraceae bacterium]MCB1315327.1 NADH:ubiquinone reductase (Na(+)-transporting) subunit C [Leptospiraceae bacterium]
MQRGNLFTFGFALAVCIFCSVGLALAASVLKEDQEISARLDVIQNILAVAGYPQDEIQRMKSQNPRQMIDLFQNKFDFLLVNRQNQEISLDSVKKELVEKLGYKPEELNARTSFEVLGIFNNKLSLLADRSGQSLEEYDPGYKYMFLYKPEGTVESYIVPVEGYGLWNMIYGYIALKPDLATVDDIVFYKHQETPGLGGEISQDWFTDQFHNKRILDDKGNFVSVGVSKVKVSDRFADEPEQQSHFVDGISGGTITGNQVTDFLKDDLGTYNSYFETIRGQTGEAETPANANAEEVQ